MSGRKGTSCRADIRKERGHIEQGGEIAQGVVTVRGGARESSSDGKREGHCSMGTACALARSSMASYAADWMPDSNRHRQRILSGGGNHRQIEIPQGGSKEANSHAYRKVSIHKRTCHGEDHPESDISAG